MNITVYNFLKSQNIVNSHSHLFPLKNFQKINSKYGQISEKNFQIMYIIQYLHNRKNSEDIYPILLLPIFLQNLIEKYGINWVLNRIFS